jgi:hypothetical protein
VVISDWSGWMVDRLVAMEKRGNEFLMVLLGGISRWISLVHGSLFISL